MNDKHFHKSPNYRVIDVLNCYIYFIFDLHEFGFYIFLYFFNMGFILFYLGVW